MKRFFVGCSLVFASANLAVAHPGHGSEHSSGYSAWHYVSSSPGHALSMIAMVTIALAIVFLASRVAKTGRSLGDWKPNA